MNGNDKFELKNITQKPKPVNGRDTRKAIEKVGHPVQFRIGRDFDRAPIIILMPGRAKIVDEVNSGIIGLREGGFITIRKITNIMDELEQHKYTPKTARQEGAAARDDLRKANAVEMGLDPHQGKSGSEYEGAVNPDGDPNFVVKAPRNTGPTGQVMGGVESGPGDKPTN